MNAIPKLHENLGTGKISSYSVSTKFTQNFRYAGEAENFSDIVNVEKTMTTLSFSKKAMK